MPRVAITFIVLVLFAATTTGQKTNPNRVYQLSEFKTAEIGIGKKKLRVWLANTASKRQEGMMFLTDAEVPLNGAMLFVHPTEQPMQFWMKNTLIPLDIAYIDAKGKVVTVATMRAKDETPVPSKKAAKYALEMKKGSLSRLGVKAGLTVRIPRTIVAR